MSELSADASDIVLPVVQFTPSDIARRHIATWNGLQTDTVESSGANRFTMGSGRTVIC